MENVVEPYLTKRLLQINWVVTWNKLNSDEGQDHYILQCFLAAEWNYICDALPLYNKSVAGYGYYGIGAPTHLHMRMYTRKGCGLGPHMLPYIERTTIRTRAANEP